MTISINSFNSKGISINPISSSEFKSKFIWQYDEIPSTSGFYIIYSRKDIPLYVGESGDLKTRIKQHNDGRTKGEYRKIKREIALHLSGKKTDNKDYAELKKYFYRVEYFECGSLDRRIFELYYMYQLKTPFNKKPNIYCELNGLNSFNYAKEYLEEEIENLVCSVDGDEVDLLYFIEEDAEDLKANPVDVLIWRIHNAKFCENTAFDVFIKQISEKKREIGVEEINGEPLEVFLRKFIMTPAEPQLLQILNNHGLDDFLNE